MVSFPSLPTFPVSDVAAWSQFIRPLLQPWMHQAWCAILDPTTRDEEDNPITGETESVSITPVYTGWFRVQPLRTNVGVKKAIDSTTQRTVQFQAEGFPVDGDLPDIKPGFEMVVMYGKNDPYLALYKYVVTGAINSSMAWQRTIATTVNLEERPEYDMSDWPWPAELDSSS